MTVDINVRRQRLAAAVREQIAVGGRVESQSDSNAVLIFGGPINHILHAAIGLFTWGVWWVVWFILILTGGERRRMVEVDVKGVVLVRDFGRRDTGTTVTIVAGVLAALSVLWLLFVIAAIAAAV